MKISLGSYEKKNSGGSISPTTFVNTAFAASLDENDFPENRNGVSTDKFLKYAFDAVDNFGFNWIYDVETITGNYSYNVGPASLYENLIEIRFGLFNNSRNKIQKTMPSRELFSTTEDLTQLQVCYYLAAYYTYMINLDLIKNYVSDSEKEFFGIIKNAYEFLGKIPTPQELCAYYQLSDWNNVTQNSLKKIFEKFDALKTAIVIKEIVKLINDYKFNRITSKQALFDFIIAHETPEIALETIQNLPKEVWDEFIK